VITPAVDQMSLDTTDIPIIARRCSAAGQVSVPSATIAQWISKLRRRQFNRLTRDLTLDDDDEFRNLLVQAGSDPVMQRIQDQFFEKNIF
jgi:hypothetical protein